MRQTIRFVVALACVVAIGGRAHAQGVLQNTYDRDSWPNEEVRRTIVIPEQMWQLQLQAGLVAAKAFDPMTGDDTSVTSYQIVPTVAYGINRNVTIGASQFTHISSENDVSVGAGSVFAIVRPFNDYDVGVRADVPFEPDSPTVVDLRLHLVGHVSLSLDRAAFFFDTGSQFNVTADENASGPTQVFGLFDFVFQLSPQLSLSAGGGMTYVSFPDFMGFGGGTDSVFDVHGKALFALGNGVDIFGILGATLNDEESKYLTAGVTVWR